MCISVRYIHQNQVKARMIQQPDEWRWSSCREYYGKNACPKNSVDCHYVLRIFSTDRAIAIKLFKEFNERKNNDQCLDDRVEKID